MGQLVMRGRSRLTKATRGGWDVRLQTKKKALSEAD